jgi:hypothetical protein
MMCEKGENMMRGFFIAASLLTVPAAAIAHHGWSSYDETKVIKHRAALSEVRWGNPHGSARVKYRGSNWDVILAPVSRMEARGLTKEMVGPKSLVVIEGYPRRDGTREMRIERVIAGGKTIELR